MDAVISRSKKNLPPVRHEPGSKRVYIIDGMHLAYRSHFVHRRLSYQGKGTGIMFGFLSVLKSLIMQQRPERVIVCWDGEKSKRRLKWLPEYKSHREKNIDLKEKARMNKQIIRLRKMLYLLGVPQAHNPAVEGDDMVYLVTKQMVNLHPITIYSGDKDFCQLITRDVMTHNPRDKYPQDYSTFFLTYKYEIHQVIDYLSLVGDDSDDIPGYRGIGPVRAAKFLNIHGSIKNFLSDKNRDFSGISDRKALRTIWKRNRRLISLKWYNDKYHTPKDILYFKDRRNPQYNEDKFKEMCRQYGLRTFLFDTFLKPYKDLYNG
jgi:DNA polymerase-1